MSPPSSIYTEQVHMCIHTYVNIHNTLMMKSMVKIDWYLYYNMDWGNYPEVHFLPNQVLTMWRYRLQIQARLGHYITSRVNIDLRNARRYHVVNESIPCDILTPDSQFHSVVSCQRSDRLYISHADAGDEKRKCSVWQMIIRKQDYLISMYVYLLLMLSINILH